MDFSNLYSDVHSPLALAVIFKSSNCVDENNDAKEKIGENVKKIKKWNSEKETEFIQNIDRNKISELENELSFLETSILSKENINIIVEKCSNIILESAEKVFGTYNTRHENVFAPKIKKPWFNKECWEKRKCFRIAKRRYKHDRSAHRKEHMKKLEREYKTLMDISIKKHRKEIKKKMDLLKGSNAKEFWKILNAKKGAKTSDVSINVLFEYFKSLNSQDNREDVQNLQPEVQALNEELNAYITENEIYKCIKELKNGKACGDDLIINEYIKSTCNIFMPLYVKIFNIIFNSANVPESWLIGNIIPFYKNKGDMKDPQNYRPITILSCFGKLFTSVLNLRLCNFLENYLLLEENQFGFRKGYSTIDSIFVIHILFELLRKKKKKMFCAFIDFAKAFDTVWRSGLWSKLIEYSVNGKMYDTIVNMYSNIKSRVSHNSEFSDFFPCNIGVRQGENLSPILFSIYLNDLEAFLGSKNVDGLSTLTDELETQFNQYLKLFVILYADDTVLLSESYTDLQKQLDSLAEYCELWKLKVNVQKSKVMIFTKGRMPQNTVFKYNNDILETVNEFTYLGVLFSRTGSFSKTKKAQADKATRAMYDILKKGRLHNLSIKCQLELFDKVVKPILLYGCEVWGHGNNAVIERVHLKFCKLLLKLKKSTPDFMVYGELGRYPLDVNIKLRTINYWSKLINGKPEKLPVVLYKFSLDKYGNDILWLNNVKKILDECGMSYIWESQYFNGSNWLNATIKQILIDQFKQIWKGRVYESPKGLNYRLFKENLEFEEYFTKLDDKNISTLCKFRTVNHKLPIETGRWRNIARENRLCLLCNSGDIGDEYHYIFSCSAFEDDRKSFVKQKFRYRPNIVKFKELMNSKNLLDLNNLCKFIRIINKRIDSPG